ncbi:hypothetical protein D3C72_337790 [compost metagenome]
MSTVPRDSKGPAKRGCSSISGTTFQPTDLQALNLGLNDSVGEKAGDLWVYPIHNSSCTRCSRSRRLLIEQDIGVDAPVKVLPQP